MLPKEYSAERITSIRQALTADYSVAFQNSNFHDSKPAQRASVIKRIRDSEYTLRLRNNKQRGMLLDLGSGQQLVENEYPGFDKKPFPYNVITLDNARLGKNRLLGGKLDSHHVLAEGSVMPIQDSIVDITISNMALDFMPPRALLELRRVMKSGGQVFLNLHTPRLYEWIERDEKLVRSSESKQATLYFWKYLRDFRILFESVEQIQQYFSRRGFIVEKAELAQDSVEKHNPGIGEIWWEVNLIKL